MPRYTDKLILRAKTGENKGKTHVIRVSAHIKQRMLDYKEKHIKSTESYFGYNDIVRHMLDHIKKLEDKVLKLPWRYRMMHKWVLHGDTKKLLEAIGEDVQIIIDKEKEAKKVGIKPPWDHSKDMQDIINFLGEHVDEW